MSLLVSSCVSIILISGPIRAILLMTKNYIDPQHGYTPCPAYSHASIMMSLLCSYYYDAPELGSPHDLLYNNSKKKVPSN